MLDVKLEINDKKATVIMSGKADTPSSEKVYKQFEQAVDEGCTEFVFDLTDVEYVCSSTLRSFLRAQKMCSAKSFDMCLTGATEGVKDVFEITGLLSVINFV